MTNKEIRPVSSGTDQELVYRTGPNSTFTRLCMECGERKRLEEMAPDRSKKDGVRAKCKECRAQYDRGRYEANGPRMLAQQRQYRRANPGVRSAARHRARANKFNLLLTTERFTYEELIAQWGDVCVHCRIRPFEVTDHVMPVAAGGCHTLMNVVPSCRECNGRKRWTFDEGIIRDHREAWSQWASAQA